MPEVPPYRITLFYGPEPVEGKPDVVHCVFNVKKRSWKGGVQVSVELDDRQVARARDLVVFEGWLDDRLAALGSEEREDTRRRAHDCFVQALCAQKLDLAIAKGIMQENHTIPAAAHAADFEARLREHRSTVTRYVADELDLPAA